MKKSILICTKNFNIGGVNKSLINFIKHNSDKYSISIYCFSRSGELINDIPPQIEVIEANPFFRPFGISHEQAKAKPFKFTSIMRFVFSLWSRLFSNVLPVKIAILFQKKIRGFDLALSYMHDGSEKMLYYGTNDFILNCVEAKTKISYIHGDFEAAGLNTPRKKKNYINFDYIFCVSNTAYSNIIHKFPEIQGKVKVFTNYLDVNQINIMSNIDSKIDLCTNGLSIVSVARLSQEKAFDRSLEVFSRLKKDGYKFVWNIVGEGTERNNLEVKIKQLNLEKCVHLIGFKANPYPYIKNSDLTFVGSFHEAAPTIINESLILGIPVFSTDTTSAIEMIGPYGFVVKNNSEDIYKGLVNVFSNPKLLSNIRCDLLNYKLSSDSNTTVLEDILKE